MQIQYPEIFRRRSNPLPINPELVGSPNILGPSPGASDLTVAPENASNMLSPPAEAVPTAPIVPPIAQQNLATSAANDPDSMANAPPIAGQAQPVHAEGWKDRWLGPIVNGALRGFAVGGLGGAIGGAGGAAVDSAVNPDRRWKQKQIAVQTAAEQQQAKETKDAQSTATLELTNARTDALKHPKVAKHQILTATGWITRDDQGNTEIVKDPVTGKQAQGRPTGSKEEWVHDEQGIAHKYVDGKDSGQIDPGRNLKAVEGYGLVSPGVAMNADATAGRDAQNRIDKNTEISATNAAIDAEIKSLQDEFNALGPKPPTQIEHIGTSENAKGQVTTSKSMVANPAYEAYMTRQKKLNDDIRAAKAKKKSPLPPRPAGLKSDSSGLFAPPQ